MDWEMPCLSDERWAAPKNKAGQSPFPPQRVSPFDNIADLPRRQSRMDFSGGMCYHESNDFYK